MLFLFNHDSSLYIAKLDINAHEGLLYFDFVRLGYAFSQFDKKVMKLCPGIILHI